MDETLEATAHPAVVAIAGVGLVAAVALGQAQPVGLVGVFGGLAELDRSLRYAEWWGLPILDGLFGIVLIVGFIEAGIDSVTKRRSARFALASVGWRVGWFGVLVAWLSLSSAVGIWGTFSASSERLPSGAVGWLLALAAMSAVTGVEERIVARMRPQTAPAIADADRGWIARGLVVEPWSAVLTGTGILVGGAAGVGFVRAGACRLGIALFAMLRGRRTWPSRGASL